MDSGDIKILEAVILTYKVMTLVSLCIDKWELMLCIIVSLHLPGNRLFFNNFR